MAKNLLLTRVEISQQVSELVMEMKIYVSLSFGAKFFVELTRKIYFYFLVFSFKGF
jgi:hypothetical protein